jgi:hypothetical protein
MNTYIKIILKKTYRKDNACLTRDNAASMVTLQLTQVTKLAQNFFKKKSEEITVYKWMLQIQSAGKITKQMDIIELLLKKKSPFYYFLCHNRTGENYTNVTFKSP